MTEVRLIGPRYESSKKGASLGTATVIRPRILDHSPGPATPACNPLRFLIERALKPSHHAGKVAGTAIKTISSRTTHTVLKHRDHPAPNTFRFQINGALHHARRAGLTHTAVHGLPSNELSGPPATYHKDRAGKAELYSQQRRTAFASSGRMVDGLGQAVCKKLERKGGSEPAQSGRVASEIQVGQSVIDAPAPDSQTISCPNEDGARQAGVYFDPKGTDETKQGKSSAGSSESEPSAGRKTLPALDSQHNAEVVRTDSEKAQLSLECQSAPDDPAPESIHHAGGARDHTFLQKRFTEEPPLPRSPAPNDLGHRKSGSPNFRTPCSRSLLQRITAYFKLRSAYDSEDKVMTNFGWVRRELLERRK